MKKVFVVSRISLKTGDLEPLVVTMDKSVAESVVMQQCLKEKECSRSYSGYNTILKYTDNYIYTIDKVSKKKLRKGLKEFAEEL